MPIYLGSNQISEMYLGSTRISEAYLGSTLIYQLNTGPAALSAALCFDGSSQFITLDSALSLTGAFTIGQWVYFDALKAKENTLWFDTADGADTVNFNGDRYHFFFDGTNVVIDGSTSVSTGQWYYYAVTRDGSNNWELFESIGTGSVTSLDTGTRSGTIGFDYIGHRPSGPRYFEGKMGEIRVYDTNLSETQINNSKDSLIADPSSESNLVLYYRGDNLVGNVVQDESSSGNNGTFAVTAITCTTNIPPVT